MHRMHHACMLMEGRRNPEVALGQTLKTPQSHSRMSKKSTGLATMMIYRYMYNKIAIDGASSQLLFLPLRSIGDHRQHYCCNVDRSPLAFSAIKKFFVVSRILLSSHFLVVLCSTMYCCIQCTLAIGSNAMESCM